MNETKRVTTGYIPRPIQAELHNKLKRFNVLVCHRRFGKTVFCINEMIDQGLRFNKTDPSGKPFKNPRYAYLAPFYGQAKRVAWDYLKQYTAPIPGVTTNEADLRVDIPRPHLGDSIRFSLLGADNPVALKGIYLDGVILDEYAEMNPATWREVIRPTLSDRLGWALFIGTPKGRNSFWDLYNNALTDPKWFAAMYKASETGIIAPDELEEARKVMTEEEFDQEYLCSFQAGLVGAYFSREIADLEKRQKLTSVPYDPALPLNTYWDLGINDVTAIWFVQKFGREYRVVRYIEHSDLSIPELVKKVKETGYSVNDWFLPHDAQVRELGTGKSRVETFRSLGIRTKVVPRIEAKEDSINAARLILPRCVFDKENCKRGIDALMNYQRKWDSKANVFSTKPMHNWASNGADAWQQFAMAADDRDDSYRGEMETQAEMDFSPYG